MKRRGRIAVVLTLAVAFCFMLVQPAMAALEGPTQNPPYGLGFVDSDTGDVDNKEQWGRDEGRDFTFTVRNVSSYDQLLWQPLNLGIAFDGAIDLNDETLVLENNQGGTTMRYTGQSLVERLNENVGGYYFESIDTEFLLTALDENNSSPISFQLIDGVPTINLQDLTLNVNDEVIFTAHLRFRAKMPFYVSTTPLCDDYYPTSDPITGQWYGALNVYDCLHTNPANDRPVITTFEHGFFYEIPFLSMLEHDAHMEQLVGGVQATADETNSMVGYLFDEWVSRIPDLVNVQGEIRNQIALLGGTVDMVYDNVSNNFPALNLRFDQQDTILNLRFDLQDTKLEDLEEKVSNLPDLYLLLLMFGIDEFFPDPLPPNWELPPFSMIEQYSDLYQYIHALDDKADDLAEQITSLQTALGEATEIDIQVKDFQSQGLKGKGAGTLKHFVILLKVKGIPKEGGVITSIDAIVDGGDMSVVPVAGFTATEIGGGLYEVGVPHTGSLGGVKVLFIQASYTENSDTIYGSKLFTVGLHTE